MDDVVGPIGRDHGVEAQIREAYLDHSANQEWSCTHDSLCILLAVLYVTAVFTIALTTLRKGHTAMFWFGFLFPSYGSSAHSWIPPRGWPPPKPEPPCNKRKPGEARSPWRARQSSGNHPDRRMRHVVGG